MPTLLKDKWLKLSPLGEMTICDRAALGIKVARKGHPDLDLYFDKETHLPLKCSLKVWKRGDLEVTIEWLFSEFKEFAGFKHPTKIALTNENEKVLELEIVEIKAEE